jgi:hypothetical protein
VGGGGIDVAAGHVAHGVVAGIGGWGDYRSLTMDVERGKEKHSDRLAPPSSRWTATVPLIPIGEILAASTAGYAIKT